MLQPTEPRTERVTIRTRPGELRRIDAAAQVAGVTRSDVLREGALNLAREVLREAGDAPLDDRDAASD